MSLSKSSSSIATDRLLNFEIYLKSEIIALLACSANLVCALVKLPFGVKTIPK